MSTPKLLNILVNNKDFQMVRISQSNPKQKQTEPNTHQPTHPQFPAHAHKLTPELKRKFL